MVGAVAAAGALIGFLAGISHLSDGSTPTPEDIPDASQEGFPSFPSESFLPPDQPRPGNPFSSQAAIQTAIERADQKLAEENPSRALGILTALIQSGLNDDTLLLRRAVANEELGHLEAAESEYQQLSAKTENSILRDAALISHARVLVKLGQFDTALAILSQFLARSGQSTSAAVAAEATHVYSGLLLQSVSAAHGGTAGATIPAATWHPSVRRVILSVEAMPAPVSPSEKTDPFRVVSEFGQRADGFQLSIHNENLPVRQLLAEAGQFTQLKFRPSSLATQALGDRKVTVQRVNISLATLLDLVTLPHDLVWRQIDDSIEILGPEELTADELSDVRRAVVIRTLRNSLSTWPSHELAPVTWLGLAGLQLQSGETDTALSLYGQFLREYPKSPLSASAWFHKARIEIRLGQSEAAFESLYQLVDRFAGHELESHAWLSIGRLLIDGEHFQEAVRPLVRASTTARNLDVQAGAALSLATAYLLNGKNSAASLVLMDYRDAIRREPHDRVSAMLGTLARFRTVSGVRKEGEGQRLISALAQLGEAHYEQDSLRLIAGEAWKELGLYEQMATVYSPAIRSENPSQLQQRMLFEVAEWQRQSGSPADALKTFALLGEKADGAWKRRSQESEIRILLSAGKLAECITGTRVLLRTATDDLEKQRLLELLGQAHEVQGDYALAAQCYAGVVPDLTPAAARETDNE